MSRLARILQRHDNRPHFNAKVLQIAARVGSRQTAYNWMANGLESYDKLCDLLRRLPRPVTHDILTDLTEETGFAVMPVEKADGQPVFLKCVAVFKKWAEATEELTTALHDNRMDPHEDDVVEPMLQEVEREIAAVRAMKNTKRPVMRSVG